MNTHTIRFWQQLETWNEPHRIILYMNVDLCEYLGSHSIMGGLNGDDENYFQDALLCTIFSSL
jgi:hypothetical protein